MIPTVSFLAAPVLYIVILPQIERAGLVIELTKQGKNPVLLCMPDTLCRQ